MSDRVVRIASNQGFSEVFDNATPPVNLNLVDFRIPAEIVQLLVHLLDKWSLLFVKILLLVESGGSHTQPKKKKQI